MKRPIKHLMLKQMYLQPKKFWGICEMANEISCSPTSVTVVVANMIKTKELYRSASKRRCNKSNFRLKIAPTENYNQKCIEVMNLINTEEVYFREMANSTGLDDLYLHTIIKCNYHKIKARKLKNSKTLYSKRESPNHYVLSNGHVLTQACPFLSPKLFESLKVPLVIKTCLQR